MESSESTYDHIILELDEIHGYKVFESLGEGSFGTVLKAKSKLNG